MCYSTLLILSRNNLFLRLKNALLLQCFLESCVKCGKKIEENTIRTKGSNDAYHPDCFVCAKCGCVLHGKFFKNDDGSHTCETCFMVILNENYKIDTIYPRKQKFTIYADVIFKNLFNFHQDSREKCFRCGRALMESSLHALGNSYHPGNYKNIQIYFIFYTMQIVLFIDGIVNVLSKLFLLDCFMCSLCPKRLNGEVFFFSEETKQPLCKEDYER